MQKPNVDMQEKSEALPLTWGAAVHAEAVALCVADGLQSHGFALAAPASLRDRQLHMRPPAPLSN